MGGENGKTKENQQQGFGILHQSANRQKGVKSQVQKMREELQTKLSCTDHQLQRLQGEIEQMQCTRFEAI